MIQEKIIISDEKVIISTREADIWLSAHEIATLFDCFIAKITSNIRSILKNGVLDERAVMQTHYYENGNSVDRYNMEMIIALSFRIKSKNADVFRQWLVRKAANNNSLTKFSLCEDWNFFLN